MCVSTNKVRQSSADKHANNDEPYWLNLGDVAVVPLVEDPRLLIDINEFFPDHDQATSSWCFEPQWFDQSTVKMIYAIQAFLVVTSDEVVLVDGCVGSGKRRSRPQFDQLDDSWWWRFTATGFNAEDISSVVISHLHVDHVGWMTKKTDSGWRPVFGNAQHLVSHREVAYWTSDVGQTAMARTGNYYLDSVQPLIDDDLVSFVEDGHEIGECVELIAAPGHTPGNMCVRVKGSKGSLLLGGDLMHHPLQMVLPDSSTRYCVNPVQAAQTRRHFLERLTHTEEVLQTAHFAGISAGRVFHNGSGYGLRPATDIVERGSFVRGQNSRMA